MCESDDALLNSENWYFLLPVMGITMAEKKYFKKINNNILWVTMNSIPKFLFKLLEKALTLLNYLRDYQRYILYSSINKKNSLEKNITILYHVIEKGLSFKNSKVWFWRDHIIKLTLLLDRYAKKFWSQELIFKFGLSNIRTYHKENITRSDLPNFLEKYLEMWLQKYENVNCDVVWWALTIPTEEILKAGKIDKKFFSSRHSIRNFSPIKVSIKKIEEAIAISQKTPSVCNRQNTRIHVYSDDKQIRKLLDYQNGNKGFTNINNLIIITYEIGGFQWSGERNQWWIDSWMRAMSLIYGFHSIWIWTCCLNWCIRNFWKDIKIKKIGGIPNSESITMMLAIGYLPEGNIKVTASPKLKIDSVTTFH